MAGFYREEFVDCVVIPHDCVACGREIKAGEPAYHICKIENGEYENLYCDIDCAIDYLLDLIISE